MNQGGYFGAYRGGFQTLPANAYEMMTAPTKQNAETIGKFASGIGGVIQNYMAEKAADEAFQQGSDVQYQDLMSRSQATGVPMNPELAEQYKNIGQMSPQQQAVFNQSMAQEAQRIQSLYGIANQQRQAQQAQGGLYKQQFQNSLVSAGYTPPPLPTTQNAQGVIEPSILPPYPNLVVPGYGDRIGPLRPMNQRY
jgi:hypothetical protein